MNEPVNPTPKTTDECLHELLRAVERHRLMFLYWATASRQNPLAIGTRSGRSERLYGTEIIGWQAMIDAVDPAGDFLWTYRRVLDRYAQEAIGRFGPGEGMRPEKIDETGRSVPVEGGTYPYWSLGEGSESYLEETSDAILEACRALAEIAHTAPVLKLVRDTVDVARPEDHDRWYINVVVSWPYLFKLDSLISRIKTARVNLAMSPRPNPVVPPQPKADAPKPQHVADLVVLFMVTRDLIRIGRDYPDAIPASDQKAWLDEITSETNAILKAPGFDSILTFMNSTELMDIDASERFGYLMSTTLMLHPDMIVSDGPPTEVLAAVQKGMSACQSKASESVQAQMNRLANVMVVSCRCPTGTAVKDFSDPARFLQMLHRYWMLASSMVLTQSVGYVGFNPHPLLHLIENIRDRLNTCFSRVTHLDGAADAQQSCDQLVGMLTEGDFEELSMLPEWTNEKIQKVERFVARARLQIGPREFDLTAAEEFFLKQAEHVIAEHDERCRAAWKHISAKADANATSQRPAQVSNETPMSAAAPPAGASPEKQLQKIGPLLLALVAADKRVMSLGPKLRSLDARGTASNTHAVIVKVQEQVQKWVDPILEQLRDAEVASKGVGPYLVGLIDEPVAWEVNTRVAIRTLNDQLVGLILSNGGESEELSVYGAASSLCDKGQMLQAAFEAINAQAESATSLDDRNGPQSATKTPTVPPVVLGRPGDPCTVNGNEKKALTDGQYHVVSELISAGENGLSKDAIEAVRRSARRMLDDLRKDSDWAAVIIMPGQTNGRYRIRA
jgi:hypothetical protein